MAVDVKKFKTAEAVSNSGRSGFSTLTMLVIALLLAVSAGALTGVLASYYLNNSRYSVEVSALATYRPPQVTTIYADDGETVLAEFAIEKRIPIKIQDVRKEIFNAAVANKWTLLELGRESASLEDVFRTLTTTNSAAPESRP